MMGDGIYLLGHSEKARGFAAPWGTDLWWQGWYQDGPNSKIMSERRTGAQLHGEGRQRRLCSSIKSAPSECLKHQALSWEIPHQVPLSQHWMLESPKHTEKNNTMNSPIPFHLDSPIVNIFPSLYSLSIHIHDVCVCVCNYLNHDMLSLDVSACIFLRTFFYILPQCQPASRSRKWASIQ